jgi:hypothetical protein
VSEPTVRERVREIQRNLSQGALSPDMARESLVMLTGLLGYVNTAQRAADGAYKRVLLDCFETEKKANRARMVAETKPEYLAARECQDLERLVMEMIRSCRAYLRSLDSEMQLSR